MKKMMLCFIFVFFSLCLFAEDIIPTQNKKIGLRQQSEQTVSFMTINSDTSIEELEMYLNKHNIEFKSQRIWRGSGSLKYTLYTIEDINYMGINFSRIEIKFLPEELMHAYDEIEFLVCYPLSDEDFQKSVNYLNSNYKYSQKDSCYYGQARYYSNKERHKYQKDYETESSGIVYFDEISVDKENSKIFFCFSIERKNSIIDIQDNERDLTKKYVRSYTTQVYDNNFDTYAERKIYFTTIKKYRHHDVEEVIRSVPETSNSIYETIKILLQGPTEEEKNNEVISLIPKDTKLLSAEIKKNVAYLNFSEEFKNQRDGADGVVMQLQQIVCTAMEFPNVKRVQILIEDRREMFLFDDVYIGGPLGK